MKFGIFKDAEFIRETDKASLFLINEEEVWVPHSLIEDRDDEGFLMIPMWFVKQKELEPDDDYES